MPKIAHIVESFDNQAVENWLLKSYNNLVECDLLDYENIFFITTKSSIRKNKILFKTQCITFNQSKFKFIIELYKLIKKEKITVLYSHHDISSGYYFILKLFLPIKTIMHVHNCSLVRPFSKKPITYKIKSFILWLLNLMLTDKVVCISEEVEIVMRKYFFFSKKYFRNYYYHPVVQQDNTLNNRSGFCYVGRLVPEKNPMRTLDILIELVKINPHVLFSVYGDGPERIKMENFVNNNGLKNNVEFHGWTKNPINSFKAHKLFIYPRHEHPKEGLGLVFLEAQYTRTIVLTSNCFSKEVNISNIFFSFPLKSSDLDWAYRIDSILKGKEIDCIYNENLNLFSKKNLVDQIKYYSGEL